MYKKAAQNRLRFDSDRGLLTVEDLFDLPLLSSNGPCLDDVAKGINKELKESSEESFVKTAQNPKTAKLQLMLDIVKDVIQTKIAEDEAEEAKVAKKIKKDKILNILAQKEDNKLAEKTPKELKKLLAEL